MKIVEIEGIGPSAAASLGTAGVTTTEALLDRGATAAGRRELAKSTGLSADLILQWVNRCDLMRLRGVGSEYSDLLEAAGVDSPTELAQRNPANLAQKFQDVVDGQPEIVRRVPTQHEIAVWIEEAKTLPKLVSHGAAGQGAGAGATGTAVGATGTAVGATGTAVGATGTAVGATRTAVGATGTAVRATGTAVGAGGTQSEATLGNPDSGSKPAGATKPASGTGSANTASATRPTNGSGVIAGSQATADGARREVGSAQAAMTSAATSATPTSLGDTTTAVSSAARRGIAHGRAAPGSASPNANISVEVAAPRTDKGPGGKLYIDTSQADGFIEKLLGGVRVSSDFDLSATYDLRQGLDHQQLAIEIAIPAHVNLGPISVPTVYLIGSLDGAAVSVEARCASWTARKAGRTLSPGWGCGCAPSTARATSSPGAPLTGSPAHRESSTEPGDEQSAKNRMVEPKPPEC